MEDTKEQQLKEEAKIISEAVMGNMEDKKKQILEEINEYMNKNRIFIVYYETVFTSLMTDMITFGALIGVLAINHVKLNDSTFGAWMLGIMFFIVLAGKATGSNRRVNIKGKEELIAYLEQIKKN